MTNSFQCFFEVVASLERVETQYAMMGQKLSEAVEAMGKIQDKVEEMKRDLEQTIREKMELESRKAELDSELEVLCCFVVCGVEVKSLLVCRCAALGWKTWVR